MTIAINGNFEADDKTRRYVRKVIGSLDDLLPRAERDRAAATVILQRVDRAHGNKYEADVTLEAGELSLRAADSTLNVLAALDIVHRKLALELKNRAD